MEKAVAEVLDPRAQLAVGVSHRNAWQRTAETQEWGYLEVWAAGLDGTRNAAPIGRSGALGDHRALLVLVKADFVTRHHIDLRWVLDREFAVDDIVRLVRQLPSGHAGLGRCFIDGVTRHGTALVVQVDFQRHPTVCWTQEDTSIWRVWACVLHAPKVAVEANLVTGEFVHVRKQSAQPCQVAQIMVSILSIRLGRHPPEQQ
mmetsp:Transcript_23145/g.60482  ORF Transcript_23145/g.60482 Transcript_23145/m.60482 type:complete len:202 (+) Transcript_23145:1841-2446(+)